jgi:hypothetical protein
VPDRAAACADAVNACLDALCKTGPAPELLSLARAARSARAALARDELEIHARALADPSAVIDAGHAADANRLAAGSVLQVVL